MRKRASSLTRKVLGLSCGFSLLIVCSVVPGNLSAQENTPQPQTVAPRWDTTSDSFDSTLEVLIPILIGMFSTMTMMMILGAWFSFHSRSLRASRNVYYNVSSVQSNSPTDT